MGILSISASGGSFAEDEILTPVEGLKLDARRPAPESTGLAANFRRVAANRRQFAVSGAPTAAKKRAA
jgi:hypothetical protein